MMSSLHSRNFLTKLSKKMSKNTIVKKGWYLRQSPIVDTECNVGIIVKDPYWSDSITEKLSYSKKSNSYSIEDTHEKTMIADVLWSDNFVESVSIKNLVITL